MDNWIKNGETCTVFLPHGGWQEFLQFVYDSCLDGFMKNRGTMDEEKYDEYMNYVEDLLDVTNYSVTEHDNQKMVVAFNNSPTRNVLRKLDGNK